MPASIADKVPSVPAPIAHILLSIITLAPLFVYVPPNINVVITAAVTVFCGCWRSIKPEPITESMTKKDAMKFPVVGSMMLFGLFLAFKFLPKDMVNMVLSAYFVLLGTLGIIATLEPLVAPFLPTKLGKDEIEIKIPAIPVVLAEGLEFSFTRLEALLGLPAAAFCAWYWTTKHWVANNILGLAFSLQGVEHLSLGAVQNGVILLCGLFFYDIFWVFCTPVMVSVAKSFDAPIKLLFPKALAILGTKTEFSMLGLGDIVIPGIYVAIMLRYDLHHSGKPKYFISCFIGYVAGITATIVVMNVFQAAQPALLYIVPAVLIATGAHAAINKEFYQLLHWEEHDQEAANKEALKKDDDGVVTPVKQAAAAVVEEAEDKAKRVTRSAIKAVKKDS